MYVFMVNILRFFFEYMISHKRKKPLSKLRISILDRDPTSSIKSVRLDEQEISRSRACSKFN